MHEPQSTSTAAAGTALAPPITLGQTVHWTNDDKIVHTVASSKLRFASEGINGGDTFSYKPRKRGRFPYFCTIHAGQTGVLIAALPNGPVRYLT